MSHTSIAEAPLTAGAIPGGAASGAWSISLASVAAPAEPQRGLFDVEVYGLREFSLIPKNDLARDLAGAWLHGRLKASLHMQGLREPTPAAEDCWKKRDNVTRLSVRLDVPPLLTNGGDPFHTGQEISAEERVIALAAIEAHRASKRPTARKRSRK
jgi:hypothetical protein